MNQSYLALWQHTFGLKDQDVVEIYHRLSQIRGMIDEVERGIMQIHDIRHQVYLKPLPELLKIISRPSLQEGWAPSKPILEMVINGLEFCSERLQANTSEILIEQTDLDTIRNQVSDLISKLESSESIPRKLRYVLFDLLNAIRKSIDEYAFRGTKGLRRELFVIISQLQENWDIIQQNKDKEEVGIFFKIVSKLDKVTSAAMKVKELITGVAPYVPLLIEGAEHMLK